MIPTLLEDGYPRFRRGRHRLWSEEYELLGRNGQRPSVFVISCCDSRVSPETIFDARPGDIFVMRNIANIVPPFELSGQYHGTSAALDFAVRNLRVRDIVVLGHSHCAGIETLLNGSDIGEFLGPWLGIIKPSCLDRDIDFCVAEQRAVRVSLANLRTFPLVQSRLEEGSLRLTGLYFDVDTGELSEIGEPAPTSRSSAATELLS